MTGLSAAGRRRFFVSGETGGRESTDIHSRNRGTETKKTNVRQQNSFQYSEIVLYCHAEEKGNPFSEYSGGKAGIRIPWTKSAGMNA
jgi:hypothetical protein